MPNDGYFLPFRMRPRIPPQLWSMPARCLNNDHTISEEPCCYYMMLRRAGYSEKMAQIDAAELDDLQKKQVAKPTQKVDTPAPETTGGAVAAWLRRRARVDIGPETQVDSQFRDEPAPDGAYVVINGERVRIDG